MSLGTPRLRVFTGPNGSGKSTIKEALRPQWLGVYVNADEIEKAAGLYERLDLAAFELTTADLDGLPDFFSQSSLLAKFPQMRLQAQFLRTEGTILSFDGVEVNSDLASVLSDFIRHRLLAAGRSFTFETVMSSPDKVEFMRSARQQGFRTYLYFVATDDPEINIERVRNRVLNGGIRYPWKRSSRGTPVPWPCCLRPSNRAAAPTSSTTPVPTTSSLPRSPTAREWNCGPMQCRTGSSRFFRSTKPDAGCKSGGPAAPPHPALRVPASSIA